MQKVVAIHQPNLLPWLGFFVKMLNADSFIFLDDVIPSRGSSSWVNRTMITANNCEKWLTVPLKNETRGKVKISSIVPASDEPGSGLLRTIRSCYPKSRCKSEALEWLSQFETSYNTNFVHTNSVVAKEFLSLLELRPPVLLEASSFGIEEIDRNRKLIKLVQAAGGTTYLAGEGSRVYLQLDLFEEEEISIVWNSFATELEALPYEGLHHSFVDVWIRYGLSALEEILGTLTQPKFKLQAKSEP